MLINKEASATLAHDSLKLGVPHIPEEVGVQMESGPEVIAIIIQVDSVVELVELEGSSAILLAHLMLLIGGRVANRCSVRETEPRWRGTCPGSLLWGLAVLSKNVFLQSREVHVFNLVALHSSSHSLCLGSGLCLGLCAGLIGDLLFNSTQDLQATGLSLGEGGINVCGASCEASFFCKLPITPLTLSLLAGNFAFRIVAKEVDCSLGSLGSFELLTMLSFALWSSEPETIRLELAPEILGNPTEVIPRTGEPVNVWLQVCLVL